MKFVDEHPLVSYDKFYDLNILPTIDEKYESVKDGERQLHVEFRVMGSFYAFVVPTLILTPDGEHIVVLRSGVDPRAAGVWDVVLDAFRDA